MQGLWSTSSLSKTKKVVSEQETQFVSVVIQAAFNYLGSLVSYSKRNHFEAYGFLMG